MSILFGKQTFTLVRGASWTDDIILTNQETGVVVDLTGIVSLKMRVREFADSPILLELSTAPGNERLVVVDAAAGRVGFRLTTADTLLLPENGHYRAVYLYDALIERTAGEWEPAVGGKIIVLPTITRPSGTT